MIDHTFVILAHKESLYLEACVESILIQSKKSEVIITTSTPSDFSREIANRNHIKYIVNDSGKIGVVNDFNFAFTQAKTKYVTLAHQDDLYEPNYAKRIIDSMNKSANPLIAFTSCSELVKGNLKKHSFKSFIKQLLLFPFLVKQSIGSVFVKRMIVAFGNPINCPTVAFNKQLLPSFKFSEKYPLLYDWDAWLKLANQNGAFVFVNEKLVQYRFHDLSVTTSQLNHVKEEETAIMKNIWGESIGTFVAFFYKLNNFDRA